MTLQCTENVISLNKLMPNRLFHLTDWKNQYPTQGVSDLSRDMLLSFHVQLPTHSINEQKKSSPMYHLVFYHEKVSVRAIMDSKVASQDSPEKNPSFA